MYKWKLWPDSPTLYPVEYFKAFSGALGEIPSITCTKEGKLIVPHYPDPPYLNRFGNLNYPTFTQPLVKYVFSMVYKYMILKKEIRLFELPSPIEKHYKLNKASQ